MVSKVLLLPSASLDWLDSKVIKESLKSWGPVNKSKSECCLGELTVLITSPSSSNCFILFLSLSFNSIPSLLLNTYFSPDLDVNVRNARSLDSLSRIISPKNTPSLFLTYITDNASSMR